MTPSPRSYAARDWIPARESFAAQPAALLAAPRVIAEQLAAVPPAAERVLVVGIGASYAAAATGVHRLRAAGVDASRHLPGELVAGRTGRELVIAVSQSGRSAEVVELARDIPRDRLVTITNYRPSPLGELAGVDLGLGDHADSAVSFLTFSATLLAFGMLADHWAGTLAVEHWEAEVRAALSAAESAEPALDDFAEVLAAAPFIDFVAPAPIAAIAEEAALVFREGPLVAATGMETRLYLHGPMDVAGPGAHVIYGGRREAVLVDQLAERTGNLLFLGTSPEAEPRAAGVTYAPLDVPTDEPVAAAVAGIITAQYIALRTAEARGIDIDRPVFTRLDTKTSTAAAS